MFGAVRIAMIDNSKLNADLFIAAVQHRYDARHASGEIRIWRKDNSGRGASFLHEVIAWKPDLVINGIGD